GWAEVSPVVRAGRPLSATRPDLVHLTLATATNNRHLAGAAVSTGLPVVATLHLVAPLQSRIQIRMLGPMYRRVRRFIAVSQESRSQLCSELGVSPEAGGVVTNGVRPRAAVEPKST